MLSPVIMRLLLLYVFWRTYKFPQSYNYYMNGHFYKLNKSVSFSRYCQVHPLNPVINPVDNGRCILWLMVSWQLKIIKHIYSPHGPFLRLLGKPHRANKSCGAQDALAVGSAVKKASFEKFFKKIKRFIDTSEMISFSWFGVKYGYVKLEQIYMVGFSFIMRISLK